jgi:hypothetical protein
MNALMRFLRHVFKPRPDGISDEFRDHYCDPVRCCGICGRHTMPHRGCMLR